MSDQQPPEELPPTHRGYGEREDQNPFTSPSGPSAEVSGPTYQPYSPQPPNGAPQQAAYGYGYPVRPDHPQATTALVLGLVALAGGFVCILPILAGPFAWVVGARVRREIDQDQRYGGRDRATAGMVMGIIATGLLALGVLFVVLAIVVVVAAGA